MSQSSTKRRRRFPAFTIGTLVTGVATMLGMIADASAVINLSATWFAWFGLALGFFTLAFGAVLFGREFGEELGWRATRAAAVAALGLAIAAVSIVLLAPSLKARLSQEMANQALAQQPPITLSWGQKYDLDPKKEASDTDLEVMTNGFEAPWSGRGIAYARVSDDKLSSCSSARDWITSIRTVADTFLCVKTDSDRFVIIEILSVDGSTVTFRRAAEGPLPSP